MQTCSAEPPASTIDARLVLAALQGIRSDIGDLRETLANVDCTSSNNARRLEAIDGLLRSGKLVVAPPIKPLAPARQSSLAPSQITLAEIAATGIVALLLLPQMRRRVQRGLRSLPLAVLAFAQISASAALLAYRGHDLLGDLIFRAQSAQEKQCSKSARNSRVDVRQLVYLLLLASVAAVPAKALAHALPDARRSRRQPPH